jgi:hypothetical protein
MALLVDPAIWPWRGMLFCHLVSDESLEELHAFARWIGAPTRAFGGDHYDVGEFTRNRGGCARGNQSRTPAGAACLRSAPTALVSGRAFHPPLVTVHNLGAGILSGSPKRDRTFST